MKPASAVSASKSLSSELTRSLAWSAIGFLLIAVMTVIVAWTFISKFQPELRNTIEGSRYLRDTHQGMVDQETGLRGFLLTNETESLEPYSEGAALTQVAMSELSKFVAVHGQMNEQFLDLSNKQQTWQNQWAAPVMAQKGAQTDPTPEVLTRGEFLFDEYRASYGAFLRTMTDQRDSLFDRQQTILTVALLVEAATAGLFIFVVAAIHRRLRRSIELPVRNSVKTMQKIVAGDLSVRPSIEGPQELREINVALYDMTQSLERAKKLERSTAIAEKEQTRRLSELLLMAQHIGERGDPASVSRVVASAAQSISRYKYVSVWITSINGDELFELASVGDKDSALAPDSTVRKAIKQARPAGFSYHNGDQISPAEMAFPLVIEGKSTGALYCSGPQEMELLEVAVGLLETLVIHAASAIERTRLSERMNLILQSTSDAIIETDNAGKTTFANKAAIELFGFSLEQMLGSSLHDLVHHHKPNGEPYPREECDLFQALSIGTKQSNVVETFWHADGTAITAEISIIPIAGQGSVITAIDVSARVETEKNLLAARDEAEAASRIKSEFLANMSHEIRTPLNGVIGMTGLLLDTELDEQQREFAETVRRSGQSLLDVISDILDFSKIEAGRLDLELIDFDLRTVIEEVGDLFATRAYEKNLELAVLVDPDVPVRVHGDPGRFRQILTNLTGNAIKFTDAGEVIIRVYPSSASDGDDVSLRVEVSDTGLGLRADQISKLFSKFAQADTSTTRKYGGTGLGLSICKQLCELMGGEIGVESEYGAGSTFWFTVQMIRRPNDDSTLGEDTAKLRALSVLVVDDNETNRQILEYELEVWGIKPSLASSADKAMKLMIAKDNAGDGFDVVILDGHMPEVDGYQLADQIVADKRFDAVKLILLTSSVDNRQLSGNVRARLLASLTKPARQGLIRQALAEAAGVQTKRLAVKEAIDKRHLTATSHDGRILVAEDNPTNQRVAALMAERLGFRVDLAANGREAVEAAAAIKYNAILMDCQMPEMDGYEASRKIRANEIGSRVPIIAMTASVLSGERDRCLEAGMDDYLAKPVTVEKLERLLMDIANESALKAGEQMKETKTEGKVIDLARLEMLKDLQGPENPNEFENMVSTFLDSTQEKLHQLVIDLNTSDVEASLRTAHSIAGSSSTFAATALSEVARKLEDKLRHQDLDGSREIVHDLDTLFTKTRTLLLDQVENNC